MYIRVRILVRIICTTGINSTLFFVNQKNQRDHQSRSFYHGMYLFFKSALATTLDTKSASQFLPL